MGWLPILSFGLVCSLAAVMLKFYDLFYIFISSLLSIAGIGVVFAIIYTFDNPMLNDMRNAINNLFNYLFNFWAGIPLPLHRHITHAYASFLVASSPAPLYDSKSE